MTQMKPIPMDRKLSLEEWAATLPPDGDPAWAYFAGFFDGEGCISMHYCGKGKRKGEMTLSVAVSNTDERLVMWVHDTFHGGLSCDSRAKKTHKMRWKNRWTNRKGAYMLRKMLPHLKGIKKDRAMIAFEFVDQLGVKPGMGNPLSKRDRATRHGIYRRFQATYN